MDRCVARCQFPIPRSPSRREGGFVPFRNAFQSPIGLLGLPSSAARGAASMGEGLSGAQMSELFPELLAGVRLMEGRLSPNDLARHVVRAAMTQAGVCGARLWRVERGQAEVWASEGNLPPARTQA